MKANVLVLDAEGKPVGGVKLEDLKISEDGVEQTLTGLESQGAVEHLALVIETSSAMRSHLEEIIAFTPLMGDLFVRGNDAVLIGFSSSDHVEVLQDWTRRKEDLTDPMDNLYVTGSGAAPLDAVYLAAESIGQRNPKNEPVRSAVVLISNAVDEGSYYTSKQALEKLKEANIQVFIISFAEPAPEGKDAAGPVGPHLALETGGTRAVLSARDTTDAFETALKKVAVEMQSQYVVTWTPGNQARDGAVRKLSASIASGPNGEKRTVVIRENFAGPKE